MKTADSRTLSPLNPPYVRTIPRLIESETRATMRPFQRSSSQSPGHFFHDSHERKVGKRDAFQSESETFSTHSSEW